MQPESPALPGAMAMRAYVVTMLCHELCGHSTESDRYLRLFENYAETERLRGFTLGGLPEAALLLARRGDFARARELLPLERGEFLSLHLGAMCEVVRLQESWDEAPGLVSLALEEHAGQDLPLLASLASRLKGAAAIATGDTAAGLEDLRASISQLAEIGATWEEAVSRLLLAEALYERRDPASVEHARTARVTFEKVGSIRELGRAERIISLQ